MITALAFLVLAGIASVARAVFGHRLNVHDGFAYGTLTVNVTGAFALGLLHTTGPPAATVLGTGMLGAYTTFSSFARDGVALAELGRWDLAAGYVVITLGGALLAAAAGIALTG